jgi:hypothetical protein
VPAPKRKQMVETYGGYVITSCPDCKKAIKVSKHAAQMVKIKNWTCRCNKCGKDVSGRVILAM